MMKKLITILCFFIGCAGLIAQAQTYPMVVAGEMYNSGSMRSSGAIHIVAQDAAVVPSTAIDSVGAIDNRGTIAVDTVFIDSNDYRDGLLRVKDTTTVALIKGTSTNLPKAIIVRKKFSAGDQWFHASFPFTAETVLKKNASGNLVPAVRGDKTHTTSTDYYVSYFDAKDRALSGEAAGHWKWLKVTADSAAAKIDRGTGYQFAKEGAAPGDLYFVANSVADLTALSTDVDRTLGLRYYRAPKNTWVGDYGAGWNYIGGGLSLALTDLTDANFSVGNTNNSTYNHVAYFRILANPSSTTYTNAYDQINLSVPTNEMTISPYVPFYIQIGNTAVLTLDTLDISEDLKISKNASLLRPIIPNGGKTHRSSSEVFDQDILSMTLTDKDNHYRPDEIYLYFKDGIEEGYNIGDDAYHMNTNLNLNPAAEKGMYLWSIETIIEEDTTVTVPLYVNRMPQLNSETTPREINIGIGTPQSGDYTFGISSLQYNNIEKAVLWDKVTNTKTDLLSKPYEFSINQVDRLEDRFVLFAQLRGDTPILTPDASDIYAYVKDGLLTVTNLTVGDRVRVLDLAGRSIVTGTASGRDFNCNLNQKGVYIVNVKGQKAAALKILNK